jgi:predicted short-subunit dehydrogenase-like oxidoreductase (DUF2520 family)
MVAAGNWAAWLIDSAAWRSLTVATAVSRTCAPVARGHVDVVERRQAALQAGGASSTTRYWLAWVKMVETRRWPNAL